MDACAVLIAARIIFKSSSDSLSSHATSSVDANCDATASFNQNRDSLASLRDIESFAMKSGFALRFLRFVGICTNGGAALHELKCHVPSGCPALRKPLPEFQNTLGKFECPDADDGFGHPRTRFKWDATADSIETRTI